MRKTAIIGLTGGYGSGKSTVADIFAENGCSVIDADELAHRAIEKGRPAWRKITGRFGKTILREDGSIDRKKLACIVFSEKQELKFLNSVIHPVVIREIKKEIAVAAKRGARVAVISAPLLIEAGVNKLCDKVVVIKIKKEVQLERCAKSKHETIAGIKKRIAAQMPPTEKLKYADCFIDNNGPLSKTEKQVVDILGKIKN